MRGSTQTIRSVLLFGTESNLALPAIRALHDAFPGISIHALSPREEAIKVPEVSRYVESRNVFKSSLSDSKQLISELRQIVKKTASQVVVPIEEKYVEFLAEHQEGICSFVQLPPLMKPEYLRKLTFKNKLSETLKDLGLPYAPTIELGIEGEEVDRWGDYPCVIKPVHAYSGYGVDVIRHEEEVAQKLEEGKKSEYVRHEEGYILQELIPGYNIDCSLIADKGHLKVLTMQRAIGEPGMTYSKSIRLLHSKQIRSYVEKLVKETGYSGVAHLDFRYDERDNNIRLIDFNARVWSSLMGSAAVGVNFMKYLVLLAAENPFEEPDYEEACYHMGAGSLRALWSKIRGIEEEDLPAYYDLRSRLRDPIPEFLNVWYRIASRYIDYNVN